MDKREAILDALFDILKQRGVASTSRNKVDFSDDENLPAVVLLDGDEVKVELNAVPTRASVYPAKIEMRPEVRILAVGSPEIVGKDTNKLRARLVKAVLTNTELLEVSQDDRISYTGCSLRLTRGARGVLADMLLGFSIRYILRPDEL